MNNKNKELGNLWISKANHDLTNAEIILESNRDDLPFNTVCFHCQQSVEKYLKAFLVFHCKEFPPTHNIANLISRCMDIDKNF
ncbi:MAG: HEPN domain-containing protein, partial [Leptospiraceae bacterium]|nr:HEPN domain-containing protein [Leptospiraceae bacterium]